jgi:hypothetical protein
LLYVDVPWVQPYCDDTPDRYRFSHSVVTGWGKAFETVATGVSVTAGSALVMQAETIARHLTPWRIPNIMAARIVSFLLGPFRRIRTRSPVSCAGGFYGVLRKPIG